MPPGRLWPNAPSGAPIAIEVFGATGEYKAGKTILGLSIAPGVHPVGHWFAGRPRTLYLDFEKSGGTYGGTGAERIDVPTLLIKEFAGKYGPLQVFEWFQQVVANLAENQYDVIMADPVTDLESGLVDYVRRNCGAFGLTGEQVKRAPALLWGAVKDYWKLVLLKLSSRCQCFFFTSHLRDVWSGNAPTGEREPKGKETLMELASLYLWLERKADKDGNEPARPSATVVKQRLADTFMDDAGALQVVNLLPPRLPVATVEAIRRYIARPPDYRALKEGERVVEAAISEEKMARLKLATAEAERATEETRLARLARMAELQTMQRAAGGNAAGPPPADQTAAVQAAKAQQRQAAAEAAAVGAGAGPSEPEPEPDNLAALQAEGERLAKAGPPEDRPAAPGPSNVTGDGADNQGDDGLETDDEPVEPRPGDKATRVQVAEILQLATDLKLAPEKLKAMLARVSVAKVPDLSREHALLLIQKLRAEKDRRAAAASEGGATNP